MSNEAASCQPRHPSHRQPVLANASPLSPESHGTHRYHPSRLSRHPVEVSVDDIWGNLPVDCCEQFERALLRLAHAIVIDARSVSEEVQ